MEKREYNYDLLRIVSTVAVIMIHVSSSWFGNAINDIAKNGLFIDDILSPFWVCMYNSISRFAVPCFVMLSGAFILDNEKNAEYKKFYANSFAKIGIPTIIFTILYILYQAPSYLDFKKEKIVALVANIIQGTPMYHMWYLYMLIGIYALAPIVLRFKNSIPEKNFHKVAFVFLALASISMWTSRVELSWDVGRSFEYLGYFMVGYSIRKTRKGGANRKAIPAVLMGIVIELCVAGLEYRQMAEGVVESELRYSIVEPGNPLIVLASILIFYGFTVLDVKKDLTGLSGLTFWIYLIHAGVWDSIYKVITLIKGKKAVAKMDGAIWIPVFVVVVLVVSCVLSRIYIWLWGKIDKEKRITNRLLRMVHLYVG